MIRLAILAGATLLGAIACSDDPQKSALPTAPVTPSISTVRAVKYGSTSVCLSYLRKRSKAEVRLANSPNDTTVQKEVAQYDRMLANACR